MDIFTVNIGAAMDANQPEPTDLLPLTPAVFHILLSLVDEERHGYGIMKEVEARTDGRVHLKPGTLYQAIKRLLDGGLIKETVERVDPDLTDERRRYYRLTAFGQTAVSAEAERLARMVDQAVAKQVIQRGRVDSSSQIG
jgi:DNA-binding PadR family transcriptional regulator